MITAQDIREKTFEKSRIGGYDMASVDNFLEEIADDITSAQKENSVLKSKMKVLVDKIEEYRANEEAHCREPCDEQADEHEQHRHENDQDLVLREEKCPGAITDVSRDLLHPFRTGVSLGDHGGLPCGKQQSQNRAQQNYPNDVFHSFHSLNVLYKIECLTLLYHSNNTARFFQVNLPNEQITLNKFYVLPNFFLESF